LTAIVKVVLDANVLVSAVIAQGASHRIVARWLEQGDLEVVVCPALLAEVDDVLGRPRIQKRIEPELSQLYLATLRRIADVVADPVSVASHTRDPDDDYLVALAREHGADYIVTGDKDLLEWPEQRPPVIAPAVFEQLMGE
jgi:putative PIN family toxin of toxin-antitoxin system